MTMDLKMNFNFTPYYKAKYIVRHRESQSIIEYFNFAEDAERFIREWFNTESNDYEVCKITLTATGIIRKRE